MPFHSSPMEVTKRFAVARSGLHACHLARGHAEHAVTTATRVVATDLSISAKMTAAPRCTVTRDTMLGLAAPLK